MNLPVRPRVGVAAHYHGTYHQHWEAGCWITVRVVPWRQTARAVLLFGVALFSHRLGWITLSELLAAAAWLTLWVILSAHERWLPVLPPEVTLGCHSCFQGSWRVEFEGTAGPRPRTGWWPREWDREVQVLRVLTCRELSVVRWED